MSSRSGLRRTISAPPLPDANVDDYSAPARPRSRPRSASVSVAASTAGPSARPRPRAASFSEPAARVMFPARLYDVIQRAPPDVISWVADGSGFVVGDRERLVSEVLVAYFKQTKFASFERQLHLYGFRVRRDSPVINYHHPVFHRDKPELLATVSRAPSDKPPAAKKATTNARARAAAPPKHPAAAGERSRGRRGGGGGGGRRRSGARKRRDEPAAAAADGEPAPRRPRPEPVSPDLSDDDALYSNESGSFSPRRLGTYSSVVASTLLRAAEHIGELDGYAPSSQPFSGGSVYAYPVCQAASCVSSDAASVVGGRGRTVSADLGALMNVALNVDGRKATPMALNINVNLSLAAAAPAAAGGVVVPPTEEAPRPTPAYILP